MNRRFLEDEAFLVAVITLYLALEWRVFFSPIAYTVPHLTRTLEVPHMIAEIVLAAFASIASPPVHHTLSGPIIIGESRQTVDPLAYALVSAQVADANQSGDLFTRYPTSFETDRLMKPFSHGGSGTMMFGFLAQDAIASVVLAHAPVALRRAAYAYGLASERVGLTETTRTLSRFEGK